MKKKQKQKPQLDSKGIPIQPRAIEHYEIHDLRLSFEPIWLKIFKAPDDYRLMIFMSSKPLDDTDLEIRDIVPPNAVKLGEIDFR